MFGYTWDLVETCETWEVTRCRESVAGYICVRGPGRRGRSLCHSSLQKILLKYWSFKTKLQGIIILIDQTNLMWKIASGQRIICGRCDKIAYGTYCIAVVVNLGWWCNLTLLMVFIELLYHPSFQIGYWIALIAIQARLRVPFSERPSVLFLAFNLYHPPQMHLYAFILFRTCRCVLWVW